MKHLLNNEYQKLLTLQKCGSFSELNLLYYKLKEIKDLVANTSIKLDLERGIIICDNENAFFEWIDKDFPERKNYLVQQSIPFALKNEYPKFEEKKTKPVELVGKKF